MLWGILFLTGVTLTIMGGIAWVLYRRLPANARELAKLSYREGVKELGYENARLKRFGDWEARNKLNAFGLAKAWAAWPWLLVGGVVLTVVGVLGDAATSL